MKRKTKGRMMLYGGVILVAGLVALEIARGDYSMAGTIALVFVCSAAMSYCMSK